MVTLNLSDPRVGEHAVMLMNLRKSGLFTDEELQEMYDRQIEKDAENNGKEEN